MAVTAGGVPTPADLDALTETFFAGQKLRPAQLAELGVFVDGDKLRSAHFPEAT